MCFRLTTAVATDTESDSMMLNETTSSQADIDANDCAILQSILRDGHYNISAEDRSALESVIATLYGTNVLDGGH